MKLRLVVDPQNKYHNQLFLGERLIASGNNGLEDVSFSTKGKKLAATITLTSFDLIVDVCPESHRYEKIRPNIGNDRALAAVGFECTLLKQSAYACQGCPKQPER